MNTCPSAYSCQKRNPSLSPVPSTPDFVQKLRDVKQRGKRARYKIVAFTLQSSGNCGKAAASASLIAHLPRMVK